ncbi:MAG: hypothetical protein HKO81_03570 [Flavobacteriaceae bacterium]|nr:hypothetical protein [Flavobacteriaceae bacterium]
MSSQQKITDKKTKSDFDKKVLAAIQHLHPYVKHRLYIAESTRILPKNMYFSNGIIDDGIVKLYDKGFDIDASAMEIKLKLFQIIDRDLEELFKNEAFHKDTVSTSKILEEELDKLKEDYTVDADLDLILNTELSDISYMQDNSEHVFVYDDSDSSVLNAFEVEDLASLKSKNLIGGLYRWLPIMAADIIDLYAFGNLNFEEIAKVKKMSLEHVEKIFTAVKKSFRNHLG